ncbi:MAG: hypothetical protein AAGA55_08860 [Planctomycetota bacterium]
MRANRLARHCPLAVILLCGAAAAADRPGPALAPFGTTPGRHAGHGYYNIATGKIAVRLGDARPAGNGVSPAVWIAENRLPCADFGQTGSFGSGIIDDPDCTSCAPSTDTGQIFLDWGDGELNFFDINRFISDSVAVCSC